MLIAVYQEAVKCHKCTTHRKTHNLFIHMRNLDIFISFYAFKFFYFQQNCIKFLWPILNSFKNNLIKNLLNVKEK